MNSHAARELHKRTMIVAVVGVLALAAVAALLIRPLSGRIERTRKEIADIEHRNKTQEILQPAYVDLVKLNDDLAAALSDIEANEPAPFLIETDIHLLPESFRTAMARAGMSLETCVPDLASITRGERTFSLDIGFTGDFAGLPRWLSVLEAEKRITEIRRVEIAQKTGKQYGMALWVNMDR